MHSRCKNRRICPQLEVEAINYVSAHDNETLLSCNMDVREWVCDCLLLEHRESVYLTYDNQFDDFGGLEFYRVVNADPSTYVYNCVYNDIMFNYTVYLET